MPYKDPVKAAEQKRKWKKDNPEKVKASGHALYLKTRDSVIRRTTAYGKNHPEMRFKSHKKWVSKNRIKVNSDMKTYRKEHPERDKEIQRKSRIKRLYGISPEEYQSLIKKQKGLCAICGLPLPAFEENGLPPIDHRHSDNKVRGVVHGKCNRGIGMFDDNPSLLRKAAEYLENNP